MERRGSAGGTRLSKPRPVQCRTATLNKSRGESRLLSAASFQASAWTSACVRMRGSSSASVTSRMSPQLVHFNFDRRPAWYCLPPIYYFYVVRRSAQAPGLSYPNANIRLFGLMNHARACARESTWSSWRPFGNAMTSERNSSSQGADSGRSTLPSSIRAVCALIRTTLSPTGRLACTDKPSDCRS